MICTAAIYVLIQHALVVALVCMHAFHYITIDTCTQCKTPRFEKKQRFADLVKSAFNWLTWNN